MDSCCVMCFKAIIICSIIRQVKNDYTFLNGSWGVWRIVMRFKWLKLRIGYNRQFYGRKLSQIVVGFFFISDGNRVGLKYVFLK